MQIVHLSDIRYAVRLLRKSRAFTFTTILVLAGGLGLSTFTFSFLYTAMMGPLPLSEGDRIVRVDPMVQGRYQGVDLVDVAPLQTAMRKLTQLGAYSGRQVVVGRDGQRNVVNATISDPVLFSIARTPALMGRTLLPSDAERGAEPVVVLSYRTWEVAFGADVKLVNSVVPLNGVSTRVVGVMPKGYGFPVASEAWMPRTQSPISSMEAGVENVTVVARLSPDASREEATVEATISLRRILRARNSTMPIDLVDVSVESLPSLQIGEQRTIVFVVLNALAALILVLALVNVTNLLLARANARTRETAVRMALGAPTQRLLMQGMWESIILCIAGGVVGTALAAWGLKTITRWTQANLEGNLAFWWVWKIDQMTLISAAAFVTLAVAVLGGVVSARAARTNVREVMQDGSARSGSRQEGRASRALVALQVTTVTVLMFVGVMGGVIAQRIITLDPGFSTSHLLQGGVTPPSARYPDQRSRSALLGRVYRQLNEQDEFESVLLRTTLADQRSDRGRFALRDERAVAVLPTAHILSVLGDLSTIGVNVVDGRAFDESDDMSRNAVVVVSSSLSRRIWHGRSPVGDQIRLAGVGDTSEFRTIVGVTSDVLQGDPLSRERTSDAIYVPLLQSGSEGSALLVRYRTTELAGRQGVLAAFNAVDPLLVPDRVQPFDEVLRKLGLISRSVSSLFAFCFGFALLLALVGTYALMSHSIGLRTREIGVRRALGATDGVVAKLLLMRGGRELGVGSLIAAPMLLVIGLAFRHYFPVSVTLSGAVAIIVSVSIVALVLVATWIPTRASLRIPLSDALQRD